MKRASPLLCTLVLAGALVRPFLRAGGDGGKGSPGQAWGPSAAPAPPPRRRPSTATTPSASRNSCSAPCPEPNIYPAFFENYAPDATFLIEESNGFSLIDPPRVYFEGDSFTQFDWHLDGFAHLLGPRHRLAGSHPAAFRGLGLPAGGGNALEPPPRIQLSPGGARPDRVAAPRLRRRLRDRKLHPLGHAVRRAARDEVRPGRLSLFDAAVPPERSRDRLRLHPERPDDRSDPLPVRGRRPEGLQRLRDQEPDVHRARPAGRGRG